MRVSTWPLTLYSHVSCFSVAITCCCRRVVDDIILDGIAGVRKLNPLLLPLSSPFPLGFFTPQATRIVAVVVVVRCCRRCRRFRGILGRLVLLSRLGCSIRSFGGSIATPSPQRHPTRSHFVSRDDSFAPPSLIASLVARDATTRRRRGEAKGGGDQYISGPLSGTRLFPHPHSLPPSSSSFPIDIPFLDPAIDRDQRLRHRSSATDYRSSTHIKCCLRNFALH